MHVWGARFSSSKLLYSEHFFYKVYACVYGGLKVMINKDHINLDLIAPTSITNIFKSWLDMTNKRTKGANSCGSLCFSLVYMELSN